MIRAFVEGRELGGIGLVWCWDRRLLAFGTPAVLAGRAQGWILWGQALARGLLGERGSDRSWVGGYV